MKVLPYVTSQQPSAADIAYRIILERIIAGDYPENSKLPTEAEFARQFDISRPVVRAAIARLRESGLVASRRGSGSYVLKRPSERLLSFTVVESIADLQRCFEYRIMLEGEAAYFAAERAGPSEIARIEDALHDMDSAVETRRLMLEEDFTYHLRVCEASENKFIVESYQSITEAVHSAMNLALNLSLSSREGRLRQVQREHYEILDTIKAGDSDAAKAAMQAHIRNARRRIFEGPTPGSDDAAD